MKLYHGTNGTWVQNILKVGIEPRGKRRYRNNWGHADTVPSNAKCVYLTNSYAPYFAFNASRGKKPMCGVVEVDTDLLDKANLYPDEDFLEQGSRAVADPVPGTMQQRTFYFREHQFEFDSSWVLNDPEDGETTWWESSLKYLGTCSYHGTIPVSAITRVVVWPHKPNIRLKFVWDPSITILNQKFMGDQYKALTAKLFGDEPDGLELDEWHKHSIDNFDQSKIEGLTLLNLKGE